MKNTIKLAGLIALFFGGTAQARPVDEWDQKIEKVANKEGVPAPLLSAICFTESSHRPYVTAYDDNGSNSIGLCQVKLGTVRDLGFKGKLNDLYNGEINAKWAAKYLKYQLNRYHNDWRQAIAAYNAGSAIWSRKHPGWLINEDYIGNVMRAMVE